MDNRYGGGIWRSIRDGDFEEEDVWDVLSNKKESSNSIDSSFSRTSSSSSFSPSAARMIPRKIPNFTTTNYNASSSDTNNNNNSPHVQQQSAPVNIPYWSKITKKQAKNSKTNSWLHDNDDDYERVHNTLDYDNGDYRVDDRDDDEDDENSYKLPPHEVISRRLARTQISSFSVFEGVGRKLKGRDLSLVRNAVLIKTGFLESP